jgi:hypothetical protein
MTLLKPLNSPSMLIPYEQYYIQNLQQECKLIPEQYPGELNPLFQTAINPSPHTLHEKDQSCFSLQPGHYSSLTAPNLQSRASQGMYNFRFTILINTNNTSNYESTNQLQPSNKKLHTEHTPLRTITLH